MATGGVGTFLRVGFYDQRLATGPDGTMHLAFADGAAEHIHYAHCTGHCGDPNAWSTVELRNITQLNATAAGPYGLGVDTTGRIHVLISAVPPSGQDANALVYATCASNCGQVANWSFLDLSSLAPGASAITTESPFMVEAGGRVSFLTSGQYNSYSAQYFACASNCTALGNWSNGVVLNGHPLHAVQDATGMTHVLFTQGNSAAGEGLFFYGRCAGDCTAMASWQLSSLGFLHRSDDWAAGFAVTPGGRVFMAFNQGEITVDMGNNRKLFINSCAGAGCLDLGTWQSFTLGNLDEGGSGAWLEPAGESLLLASVDSFDVQLRTCDANCGAAASWSTATLGDSAAAINQAIPPDTGSACAGTSESASWWSNAPTAAVSALGVVVVHNPYAIVKCPGNPNPTRQPTIGRVISTF